MTCIRLLKSTYGNVNAAQKFYKTYADHLINRMNMTRSQMDACVFFKKKQKKQIDLLASCHMDDTMISGSEESIAEFKRQVQMRFKIKDLGILKKHLGIWYEWKIGNNGLPYVIATMPGMIQEIFTATEKA